jgi:hypothetical protein
VDHNNIGGKEKIVYLLKLNEWPLNEYENKQGKQ